MVLQNPVPEVYVLWHPACPLGETAARRVYQWLRPDHGQGPQVFYRSLPAPEAPPGGLPPPLPGEPRGGAPAISPLPNILQIVLLLIDAHMIADATWRHWLAQLAAPGPVPRVLVPVALDPTAFNAPPAVRALNFLRLAGGGEAELRAFLKQLTETLCRLLLGRGQAPAARDEGAPKIKIFLSHAKADGTAPARSIRDHIYSQTQLAAFYDENDIPFGSAFARVLEADVESEQTVALIAVRSAAYARRPWCRRELSLFRTPHLRPGTTNQWRLNPVLVVDALGPGAATVGIPELGNAPLVRWSPEIAGQEEQIVTTLLRDALLGAVHAAIASSIAAGPGDVVINWLPDPTTLLRVLGDRARDAVTVHHPGRGLSGLELEILGDMFPDLEYKSFEASLT